MTNLYKEFSENRFRWQVEAVESIKRSLLLYPAYENLSAQQEERFVIACGLPQSGKTELILKLLGIDPQYSSVIYDLTRAGQREGSSSTSTAISYRCIEGDNFKITGSSELIGGGPSDDSSISSIVDDIDGIKKCLRLIRERVENGTAPTSIVNLYIPEKYFLEKYTNLNILDLPGLQSRNKSEEKHVQLIARKYFPLANVVVFVCRSNEVTRLEESDIASTMNTLSKTWKSDANRFIIVTTQAYTTSSVITKNTTTQDYVEMCQEIQDNCVAQTRRHLKNSEILIFPVEVGRSLLTLEENYPLLMRHGKNFIQQIKHECNNTLNDLRQSIFERRNSHPLNFIISWTSETALISKNEEETYKTKLIEIQEEIQDLKGYLNSQENTFYTQEIILEEEIEAKKNQLNDIDLEISILETKSEVLYDKYTGDIISRFINLNKKRVNTHYADNFIYLSQLCAIEIFELYKEFEECKISAQIQLESVQELNPGINECFKGGFLGVDKNECLENVVETLRQFLIEWTKNFDNAISLYKNGIKKEFDIRIKLEEDKLAYLEEQIEKIKFEIKSKENIITSLEKEYNQSKKSAEEARSSLKNCKKYAEKAFQKEKLETFQKLQQHTNYPAIQANYLLFYALIEWDYSNVVDTVDQKVQELINENQK